MSSVITWIWIRQNVRIFDSWLCRNSVHYYFCLRAIFCDMNWQADVWTLLGLVTDLIIPRICVPSVGKRRQQTNWTIYAFSWFADVFDKRRINWFAIHFVEQWSPCGECYHKTEQKKIEEDRVWLTVLHVHVPDDPETASTHSTLSSIAVQTPDRLVGCSFCNR